MQVLVVYDSLYGNTEKIARAIGAAIGGEVKVLNVSEVNPAELNQVNLLIAGSPTQGGRHTAAMRQFLDKIPSGALQKMDVAAFDTRLTNKLVKVFGYAAGKIADGLKGKGGNLTAPGEGFFVKSTKGPVADGELERAAAWGKGIIESKK